MPNEDSSQQHVGPPWATQLGHGAQPRLNAVGTKHFYAAHIVVGNDGINEVERRNAANRHTILVIPPRVLALKTCRGKLIVPSNWVAWPRLGKVCSLPSGSEYPETIPTVRMRFVVCKV